MFMCNQGVKSQSDIHSYIADVKWMKFLWTTSNPIYLNLRSEETPLVDANKSINDIGSWLASYM